MTMTRYIDADAFRSEMYMEAFEKDSDMQRWDSGCWIRYKLFENVLDAQPTIERDVPKRVLWTGWKGHRATRYKCPTCNKHVRKEDNYRHTGGRLITDPQIRFTPYVEGQKQELRVRWDDETD